MGKPNTQTPIDNLIPICEALPGWFSDHGEALAKELGEGIDGERGAQLGAALKGAQEAIVGEERDDTRVTLAQQELVKRTQTFVGALVASTRLAFKGDPNARSIVRDMAATAPSRIRSLKAATKALQRAVQGIEAHRAGLDAVVERAPRKLAQAAELLEAIGEHGKLDAREAIETRRAYRARQELVDQALDYVQEAHLAAEALELEHPELLEELRIIYNTHNPKPEPSSSTDGLLDGDAPDLNPPVDDDPEG